jgi:hypothetical protein
MYHSRLCSRAAFVILIVAALGASSDEGPANLPLLTKAFEIAPVRLTYVDVTDIVSGIRNLLPPANNDAKYDRPDVNLRISANGETLSFSSWGKLTDSNSLPSVSYSLDFAYRSSSPDSPIYTVSIELHDFSRTVTVTGTHADQVQALAEYLRSRFDSHTTLFGGFIFRMVGAFFLFALSAASIAWLWRFMPAESMFGNFSRGDAESLRALVTSMAAGLLGSLMVFALPWNKWYPGVAIYSGSANIFERYAPEIGACSLLVGILSLVYGFSRRSIPGHPTD